jgi:hypothetical protein
VRATTRRLQSSGCISALRQRRVLILQHVTIKTNRIAACGHQLSK